VVGHREPDPSVAVPSASLTVSSDLVPRARGARLPYLPGLDGLRAVSVIAVLLYHYRTDRSLLRGGFLGVEVFFVISGYLITSLLVAETKVWQRVDLRHFWGRRIRRLWPALMAMMLVTTLFVAVFYHEDLGRLRGDVAFGFYGENWWHIIHGVSYVDAAADVGRRQPFQHLWSLAVEEQFYVAWPLIFTFGMWLGRRRLRVLTVGLALLSWTAMLWFALHGNKNHAYLGTETRAFGPLVGALLAFVYPPKRRPVKTGPRAGAILDGAALVAMLGLVVLFVTVRQNSTWLYVGGFPLTDLFTVVLITVMVSPVAGAGPVLGSRPLRWIGLRSYGIYLWGIAIFEFTRPGLDLNASPQLTLVLRALLVAAVVEVSFRYVETPVRSGAFLSAWNQMVAATGQRRRVLQQRWRAAGGVVLVATMCAGVATLVAAPPDNLQIIGGHTAVGGGDCVLTAKCSIPSAPTASTSRPTSGPGPTRPHTPTTRGTRPASRPVVSSSGWKVSGVGDSVLLGAAANVEHTLTGPAGGGVLINAAVSRHAGTCLQVLQAFATKSVLAPLVIVHCGNNGALGAGFVSQAMQIAGPNRLVMFVNLKVPRSWQDTDNAELARDVTAYRNARLFNWNNLGSLLQPQNVYFYSDGYHLTAAGREYYATHLLKALRIWHWLPGDSA
jgi:peptidoglycan/LPS O-acetylase OafA/YrhL